MQDPPVTPVSETHPRRRWIGWGLVLAAAVIVAVSFAFSSEDAASTTAPGPRATPVSVAPITRDTITERRRYPGELDALAADVSAFYAGRLVAVHVRVGDVVKQGDVLAELDPVDAREQIAQAEAQAKAAKAEERRARIEHEAAETELGRLEPLARQQIASEQEVAQQRARVRALEAAALAAAAGEAEARARVTLLRKRIVESKVRAPFAGRVSARYVDPGAIVAAGARLVRVVAESPLWVRFDVPEEDVAGLAVGTTVRVTTEAATPQAGPEGGSPGPEPSIGVAARVTGVAGEVNRQQRVVAVEALVDSPPAFWLPGMYAEAIVARRTIPQATIVPGAAVLSRLQPDGRVGTGVFVPDGDEARWVPVTVLARDGDRVAVGGELAPGGRVLVAGHADLSDGAPIALTRDARP